MAARQSLRRAMRTARRALSDAERQAASRALARRLLALPSVRRAERLAVYLANDGEIDPMPLVRELWILGKAVYLPVLHPFSGGRLQFLRYRPETPLNPNRFGIPEPDPRASERVPAWALDCVLLPLVAFDALGNRLGMGGGFYDRTFAFATRGGPAPCMLGLAYEFQRVERLPCEGWDVPLDAIMTPACRYGVKT